MKKRKTMTPDELAAWKARGEDQLRRLQELIDRYRKRAEARRAESS